MGMLCDLTGSGKIRDSGLKTSNACISATRPGNQRDISELPTAKPTFLRSSIPLGLMRILCDKTRSGKSKMAASKLQVHVSPVPDETSTKFRRLYLCFRGLAFHWDSWEYYATKPDVEKFKMAASKLQMHVSLLPDKISTKFRRLNPCFLGPAFQRD